ncbi:MAG: DUF1570 domain-containing protein [Isosphaeraceae bacterium]
MLRQHVGEVNSTGALTRRAVVEAVDGRGRGCPSDGPAWLATAPTPSRRLFLAGALSLGFWGRVGALAAVPSETTDAVKAALYRAEKAGLKGLGTTATEHYVAVGDSLEAFRKEALDLCERLGASFLSHFRAKGFELDWPASPMTVVALASRESYVAFKGTPASEFEGGYYEVLADRLVIFDFREGGADAPAPPANARRINTFSLVHEANHQLTFGTRMLDRKADVPVALSEGLATYGELWQSARPIIGQVNRPRLAVLSNPGGVVWIEVQRLLTDDDLFRNPETEQLAYAEAWLLVAQLLKTKAGTARLIAYLDRLRGKNDPGTRLSDATEALGDLNRLDRELKRSANLLIRR